MSACCSLAPVGPLLTAPPCAKPLQKALPRCRGFCGFIIHWEARSRNGKRAFPWKRWPSQSVQYSHVFVSSVYLECAGLSHGCRVPSFNDSRLVSLSCSKIAGASLANNAGENLSKNGGCASTLITGWPSRLDGGPVHLFERAERLLISPYNSVPHCEQMPSNNGFVPSF